MTLLHKIFAEPLQDWRPYISTRHVARTENEPDKIEISIGRQRPDGDNEVYEYLKIKNPKELAEIIGLVSMALGFLVERRSENRNDYENEAIRKLKENYNIGIKRANQPKVA